MIPKEICKDYIIEYKNLIINLRCRLVMVSGHLVTLYPKETEEDTVCECRKDSDNGKRACDI